MLVMDGILWHQADSVGLCRARPGLDPDTYVYGQCAEALRGVHDEAKVFMGLVHRAPRLRERSGAMHADIAYRSSWRLRAGAGVSYHLFMLR